MLASTSPTRCYDCHPGPIGTRKDGRPHEPPGKAGEDCLLCHGTVYSGSMAAPRSRCVRHIRAGEYDETNALPSVLHYTTVTEHGVACFDCHRRPRHQSTRRPVPRTVAEAQQGR